MDCDCTESCVMADQFTPATREIMVFTKSAKRYFDLDAVREPYPQATIDRFAGGKGMKFDKAANEGRGGGWSTFTEGKLTQSGAPPLDWWNLPWDRVAERLVKAMSPERVCQQCGEPSRRIVKVDYAVTPKGLSGARRDVHEPEGNAGQRGMYGFPTLAKLVETTGFSDCGHDNWRPGVVFDPVPLLEGEQMPATFYVGDAIEVMGKLPENSVDLILTSPPFLALRSYLPADHPDKPLEGGSQSTPGEYVDWLLDVVEACDRVLAPHGSLCVELGDTYSGSGGAGGDYNEDGFREGQAKFSGSAAKRLANGLGDEYRPSRAGRSTAWPLAKSLSLIPETFRFAMVYGHNPHTGRQTAPWRLRNVIRWVRPNPPVGALGDKFRPATSELMVFCKSAKRYFDLDAVRGMEPEKPHGGRGPGFLGKKLHGGADSVSSKTEGHPAGAPPLDWWNIPLLDGEEETRYGPKEPKPKPNFRAANPALLKSLTKGNTTQLGEPMMNNPLGTPPLDWWEIPPGGYEGAHYAVFPPELCIKPVKAMCPEKVCRQCGEPSRRIVDVGYQPDNTGGGSGHTDNGSGDKIGSRRLPVRLAVDSRTLGFSDCGHDDWRPGQVLDPFAGSGTTLAVATGHGRDAIGIDLDERNYDLALERVGPFILTRGEDD